MIRLFIYSLMLIFLAGCIEPFVPDVGPYERAIAVTGTLLEGKRVSEIQLGRTFSFEETKPERIGEAQVIIREEGGATYILQERDTGIYVTDTATFRGVAGLSYQLYIQTPDGQELESDWQLMKKSAGVDDFYFVYEERARGFDSLQGVQLYVDASDPENQSRYYRWEYEETWHVQVPFPARGDWLLADNTYTLFVGDSIPQICYAFEASSEILLANTLGLTEDRIEAFPLYYISTETNRLWRRYSVLLKQYSLTEEAYNFWKAAEAMNEDLGTLFDPIPNQLIGNIKNITNPDEPVLGFFSAAGYDEQRIFIDRADIDPSVTIKNGNEFCILDFFFTAEEMSVFVNSGGAFVGLVTDFFGNVIGFTGSQPSCADCREQGRLRKPDFWR